MGKDPAYGDPESDKARDSVTLGTKNAKMGNGELTTTFDLSEFQNKL